MPTNKTIIVSAAALLAALTASASCQGVVTKDSDLSAIDGSVVDDDALNHIDGGEDAGETSENYPGLPSSCQEMFNHGQGGCVNTWSSTPGPWEYRDLVSDAIAQLDLDDPLIDDPGGKIPPEKRPAFAKAISEILDPMGLCVLWDGEELYIRSVERDYSETFKIHRNDWTSQVAGHWQCEPASSIPGAALPVPYPAQGCDPTIVPPEVVETTPCETEGTGNLWASEVDSAVLAVIADEQAKGDASLIFDFEHTMLNGQAGWQDKGFRVIDLTFFHNAVASKLSPQGFCWWHNRYDTLVLQRDGARSEYFDLILSQDCGATCKPTTPSGNYVRYPGRGGYCSLAEVLF